MKKLDNFLGSLKVLQHADFQQASRDEIYRTGIVGQFHLTFELAWKALQAVLQLHSMTDAKTGSPREILKLGYKTGFLDDADTWLLMLKKRNLSIHIYDEKEIDELLVLIRDSFVPAFLRLAGTLEGKLAEAEADNWNL